MTPAGSLSSTSKRESSQASPPPDNFPWSADSWETPAPAGRTYAQRTWDEEEYLPNEAPPAPTAPSYPEDVYAPDPIAANQRARRDENPYTRPTWDESAYQPETPQTANGDGEPVADRSGRAGRRRAAIRFDADSDVSLEAAAATDAANARAARSRPTVAPEPVARENPFAPAASNAETIGERNTAAREAGMASENAPRKNPYARPVQSSDDIGARSERFAPPLKFELPRATYADPQPLPLSNDPNVYRTRNTGRAADTGAYDPTARSSAYRVEAERTPTRRRKKHRLLRFFLTLLVLGGLGAGVYYERDWIMAQITQLFGEQAAQTINSTVNQAVGVQEAQPVKGYDAAPALQVSSRAQNGIEAIAGGLTLETCAVTATNIIQREMRDDGAYDYYLFSAADGQLLGYYEALPDEGMTVCADGVIYVAMSPYLLNAQGETLISSAMYRQSVGADAVLGPMINGWSIISDAQGSVFNYINTQGELLSKLWFAKAYPFTGNDTVAYVDTGNVSDTEERYTLYELARDGTMTLWRHTADMSDVLGCASGVAYLTSGELIRLDGHQTVLCTSDDVLNYVDCAAVVARDSVTGLYGLFVNGEQQYDFAYDSIAPVASDIQWAQTGDTPYRQFTVTGRTYPLPLSHYFALRRDTSEEMVALSTSSVYPLQLDMERQENQ